MPGISIGVGLRRFAGVKKLSPAASDYFARLDAAGLRVTTYDAANARLIDRLVANGGNFWPDSGAFCAMAGYLYPGNGANLIPLKDGHDAGTLNAFVSGDWNAVTGLKGDGSTKYVDSNRNNNADGQDDQAMGVYIDNIGADTGFKVIMDDGETSSGANDISLTASVSRYYTTSRRTNLQKIVALPKNGYHGISRNLSTGYTFRLDGANNAFTDTSSTPTTGPIYVFKRPSGNHTDARLPFYHIGPNLNGTGELAELDSILTDWQTDLANA